MWTNSLPPELLNTVHCMDCLEFMGTLPDGCIDCIICDLPYGTTSCYWDEIIDFEELRTQYNRITKQDTPIVLFSSQPFTSKLVLSQIDKFKYEIIREKTRVSNPLLSNIQPLKIHENIIVFWKWKIKYNPIMEAGNKYLVSSKSWWRIANETKTNIEWIDEKTNTWRFPKTVVKFSNASLDVWLHPTQKDLELLKYLVETYSDKWNIVLDNTAGSGTTWVACKELWRNYILVEKEPKYVDIIHKRLQNTTVSLFHS